MPELTLGGRIAALLKQNGMTQRELAEKVKVTEVSMSRYIANIAAALNTTSDYLLGTESNVASFDSEYLQIHRLIARNAPHMTTSQKRELINALFESIDQKG